MAEIWKTYTRFHTEEELNMECELLDKSGIRYKIEDISSRFDPSFAMSARSKEYVIKVHKDDLERVKIIYKKNIDDSKFIIDPDHYLHTFSDEDGLTPY